MIAELNMLKNRLQKYKDQSNQLLVNTQHIKQQIYSQTQQQIDQSAKQ